ncbi:hypothetical protein HL653_16695 [Sphingomonas sp. AP4-R1]|uniref:hypothetical protein n=1 Tax=Sphingomonas sp. AP4-R1 TaxID=2735134 RepID=UPI0014934B16|nr:hypothetical protein [Sphingomonas sp. AP4-R1]QJU59182.1 hypothetical protein HL653_16695 [Sphingomonas sp. AP4-R1]
MPAIPELKPMLDQWAKDGAVIVKSRKTAWRNIRRLLNLPPEAEAKTFRYTVVTILRNEYRIDGEQIETLLGHTVLKSVSARYAKYDPSHLADATVALSSVFRRVAQAAYGWGAVHLLASEPKGRTVVVLRSQLSDCNHLGSNGAAYRTRIRL